MTSRGKTSIFRSLPAMDNEDSQDIYWMMVEAHTLKEQDFRCIHCRQPVTANPLLSGVKNRNHCPYCLSSRHLDWQKPGDRLSACKAEMRPVALTLKQVHKKYAAFSQGELMLVHLCTDCGKISINRIAADDDPERVMEIFHHSANLEASVLTGMQHAGVELLHDEDRDLVQARLLGAQVMCQN